MNRTDQDYLDFDPCEGDEGEISCRTVAMRRARKEHPCFFGLGNYGDGHTIKPGDRYRHEQALVDGSFWGKYQVCIPCMDKFLSELEGN